MKRLTLLFALIMSVAALHAQDITGPWNGKAEFGLRSLRLVFHIEKTGGGYSATMDSPDQGVKNRKVSSVAFSRDTLRIGIAQIDFTYTGVKKGDKIVGAFTQRGATFPLDLERGDVVLNRPQEPKPPYPYRSEDVVFENKQAGIKLAGTLTMPSEGKKFPAVVLLTGSGAQNRDEEIMGHKPFLVLADYLTRQGIAVLRFDDRGVGGSEGDLRSATTADLATDASVAMDYLRTRKEIDKKKIGLAGHSEGAALAFMTAANRHDVAFVVSMAGAAMPGDEILIRQNRDILRAEKTDDAFIDYYIDILHKVYDTVRAQPAQYLKDNAARLADEVTGPSFYHSVVKGQVEQLFTELSTPWLNFFAKYDPAEDIRRVQCPVMALNGNRDLQVSSSNLALIEKALREAGVERFSIKEYPGLNHLFQTSQTGKVQEYGEIEETVSPRVLEDIGAWILRITK